MSEAQCIILKTRLNLYTSRPIEFVVVVVVVVVVFSVVIVVVVVGCCCCWPTASTNPSSVRRDFFTASSFLVLDVNDDTSLD